MGSLTSNCFRLYAVVWSGRNRGLYQVVANGTLWGVLAEFFSVVGDTGGEVDEPQLVTITKLEDSICVEDAVINHLSIYPQESKDNLVELEKKAREEYSKVYSRNYAPPKTSVKYPCITICENKGVT